MRLKCVQMMISCSLFADCNLLPDSQAHSLMEKCCGKVSPANLYLNLSEQVIPCQKIQLRHCRDCALASGQCFVETMVTLTN